MSVDAAPHGPMKRGSKVHAPLADNTLTPDTHTHTHKHTNTHTNTHLANAALLCDDDVFIERHIERKEEERGMNKLTGTRDNAKRES